MTKEQAPIAFDRSVCDAEVTNRRPVRLFGLRAEVDVHALRTLPQRLLPVVASAMDHLAVRPTGPPRSLLRSRDSGRFQVTVAYPIAAATSVSKPFVQVRLAGGPVVQVLHIGPRSTLLGAYDRLSEWLVAHRVTRVPVMWEEYLIGPAERDDPATWRTRIVVPLPAKLAVPAVGVASGRAPAWMVGAPPRRR